MPDQPDSAPTAQLVEAGHRYAAALAELAAARTQALAAAVDARTAGWPIERISAALGVTRTTATAWLRAAAKD